MDDINGSLVDRILSPNPIDQVSGNLSNTDLPLYPGNRNAFDQAVIGDGSRPDVGQMRMQAIEDRRNKIAEQHARNIDAINKELTRVKNESQRKILQDELAKEMGLASDIGKQREQATEQYNYDSAGGFLSNDQVDTLMKTINSPLTSNSAKLSATSDALVSPELRQQLGPELDKTFGRAKTYSQGILDANVAEADALGVKKKSTLDSGQLAANIILEQQAQQARTATDRSGWLADNSFNTEDTQSLVRQRARSNVDISEQMVALRDKIDKQRNVSFLDDPVGFILGQVTAAPDVDKYNALSGKYNLNNEVIESTSKMIQDVNNANAGKVAAVSANEAQMLAQQKLETAKREAADADITAARSKGETLKTAYGIEAGAVGTVLSADQRDRAYEAQQLQRDVVNQASRDRLDLATDNARIKQEAADKKAADDATTVKAFTAIGNPLIATSKAMYDKLPAPKKKIYETLRESGGETLGNEPSTVNEVWDMVKDAANRSATKDAMNAQYPAQQKELANHLQAYYLNQYNDAKNIKHQKESEAEITANNATDLKFRSMAALPDREGIPVGEGLTWNPYRAANLVSLSTMQDYNKNPMSLEIQKLAAANPSQPVSTKAAVEAVAANKSIDLDAAGKSVSQMFGKIVEDNNRDVKFSRFSAPNQTSYVMDFNGKKYDLTDPTAAKRLIMNMRYSLKVQESVSDGMLGISN